MPVRKVMLYIATSADGYIADTDGGIDFLSAAQTSGEDYGYDDFIKSVDTILWGRKTYDRLLSFGIPFPYKHMKCYVLSRTRTGRDENVEYFNGDIGELIGDLRKHEGKRIYCDGGAEIVSELMKRALIDEFIMTVIPVFLGNGIALFKPGGQQLQLQLAGIRSFPSGVVQLHYIRK
jgi:dihydrofolate reductase